jgi:hypothetical protein
MLHQHAILGFLFFALAVAARADEEYLKTGVIDSDSRRLAVVTITLGIQFDKFPAEIFWELTNEAETQIVASVAMNGYSSIAQQARITVPIKVNQGQNYKLIMHDSRGDGLDSPSGFYYILYGTTVNADRSNIIFREDNFIATGERKHLFTASLPRTPAPTVAPPTISPAPTSTPTTCNPGGARHVEKDPFNPNAVFGSPATTFENDDMCTRHKDYASCTNEISEDCQWIFLSSSARKGICRIDPVTKCLQTGDCVCNTEDFLGGTSEYGNGIVFHAPISVTPRDISKYSSNNYYKETYTHPSDANQDPLHPLDMDFFVSKVDFTARQLQYTFARNSPALFDVATHTFAFKLHYLYMDTPLKGRIWAGLGIEVDIDTSRAAPTLVINTVSYTLPVLKKWTCTQIVIDKDHIFVRGISIDRKRTQERLPVTSPCLTLGKFSGQLFDVRVYSGSLTYAEIGEVGARCTGPDNPAALLATRDYDLLWKREGCDSRHELYFPQPTSGGMTCT